MEKLQDDWKMSITKKGEEVVKQMRAVRGLNHFEFHMLFHAHDGTEDISEFLSEMETDTDKHRLERALHRLESLGLIKLDKNGYE